jgi:sigma-B regulation protein RsbU (phosphoserine phosphatase)
VSGHGASAAALTSLLRYSLRSAAMHDPDPIQVLSEVNTAVLKDPGARGRFATVMVGILEPDPATGGFSVTLGTGGHEPALRMTCRSGDPGGGWEVREVLPEPIGMLVGAVRAPRFSACRVQLQPGEVLLLYTDGLTETPSGAELFEPDGLPGFLTSCAGSTAEDVVATVTAHVERFDPPPRDDIALLAIGTPARSHQD